MRIPSVTVPGTRRPRSTRIDVHRAARLDVTHVRGIPCTSVSQTLVDLAPTPMLEAAFERAERKRWVRPDVIEEMLRGRPGANALRQLLQTHRPTAGPTRSVLERRVLGALRNSNLPEPVVTGWTPLRGTWHDDPDTLVADIQAALRE